MSRMGAERRYYLCTARNKDIQRMGERMGGRIRECYTGRCLERDSLWEESFDFLVKVTRWEGERKAVCRCN